MVAVVLVVSCLEVSTGIVIGRCWWRVGWTLVYQIEHVNKYSKERQWFAE